MAAGIEPASSKPRPDFELGLALAGAISAGAYTAGVIDFLAEALQAWEVERGPGVPDHRVALRSVAGASAGAITGALGVVALARGLQWTPLTNEEIARSTRKPGMTYHSARCVLPILYEAWVTSPRMVADPTKPHAKDLLGTDDLVKAPKGGPATTVPSLLNAKVLDDIKKKALEYHLPASRERVTYPFLSESLHVYMTVSNLRGIPFTVNFGNATYGMQTHGDRFHYAIEGCGTAGWPYEPWLEKDTRLRLHVATLPWAESETIPPEWDDYGTCALASSAFPGGLAPRALTTPFSLYDGRQYPLPVAVDTVKPDFPGRPAELTDFKFLTVDGGVVNNNPFDYVEFAMRGVAKTGSSSGNAADRAVVMIAPFPEPPTFLAEGQPNPELVSVIRALFPTLINQARFRASELVPAMNDQVYNRFMISPSRSLVEGTVERYPIACGLLGGFGGFLDEQFRAHDYQLGRRNCQHFLRSVFGLPAENPVIARDPEVRNFPLAERRDRQEGKPSDFMIVPLLGEAAKEIALPHWPQMSGQDFRVLLERIGERLDAVTVPLVESQTNKFWIRVALRAAIWSGRDRIIKFIETTILSDLVRRNQIKGWDLPPSVVALAGTPERPLDDIRAILAVLVAGPSSVEGLKAATHLPQDFITSVLATLEDTGEDKPFHVVALPDSHYGLQLNVPTGARAWPLIGEQIARWRPAPYAYD